MGYLSGKRTILGSLAISLLSAMYFLDLLVDGQATWLAEDQYLALGGFIGGMTGVALRLAVGKANGGHK